MTTLAVLVVLYDCEPESSASYLSLIKNARNNCAKVHVCFWNNGPKNVVLDVSSNNIDLVETINNISLAKIYNTFIDSYDSKNYLILDDDTFVDDAYLKALIASDFYGVSIPNITSNNKVYYPLLKKTVSPLSKSVIAYENVYNLDDLKVFLSIGSGICIYQGMVEEFKLKYNSVFDERFYIYGVDTAFFIRLKKIKGSQVKVVNKLEHSLSRIDETEFNIFRFKERALENVLLSRLYPSLFSFLRAIKFFIKNSKKLNFNLIRTLIYSSLTGKHPKNE